VTKVAAATDRRDGKLTMRQPARRLDDERGRSTIPTALPGRIIDLIRDGAPQNDLQQRGDKAVRHALVRTAMSAQNRAWTYAALRVLAG